KHFTAMESRLSSSALKYAINLSASALNTASLVANDLYGLNYFWKLKSLVANFEREGPLVLAQLKALREKVTCLENPHLVLSCDAASYDELKGNALYGLQQMETRPFVKWEDNFTLKPATNQGRVIASPVAFIGKVLPSVSYAHPFAPALGVAACLFDNLVLHTKIREQGGAYGGGAVSNPMSGNFYFYSYRDPNVVQTLKAFEEAIEEVRNGNFDEEELEESKLEIIQSLDAPVSPGSQAELAYGWLREGKDRQPFRDRLLALTQEQVIEAVETVIAPQFEKAATVVFAGSPLLEKANQELLAEGMKPLIVEGI
ncbi:MAG: insulinase family protein, partial [Parachlamydia sp.]|nr:insulinase family protein [Parachlamydia sp.]